MTEARTLAPLAALCTLALAIGGCSPGPDATAGVDPNCFSRTSDAIGGPLALTGHTGAPMTEANFKGRKSLVFFGFTYCPDFCPATLYKLGTVMSLLPDNVEKPRTLLISVDPARDTPQALTAYIASNGFPEDIVGLTGTSDQLDAAAKGFVAPFERMDDPDSAAGYLMNHVTIVYLMDEDWKLETFFTVDEKPEAIATCLAALD